MARGALAGRTARRRSILDLVAARAVGSQEELAALLRERGFAVTQATVSRDIADLGLVKAMRGAHHAYVTPAALAGDGRPGRQRTEREGADPTHSRAEAGEARLRRILADYPVTIARSGLTLVLVSGPGAGPAIAQAIDESPLHEHVGTLAGNDTVLVLFADEPALERWRARFSALAEGAAPGRLGAGLGEPAVSALERRIPESPGAGG